ncbi:S1C family serine protease [Streptomyces sp. NPDC014636]|uniref:S1C family serine protease n=1 Tax=Streptomyces sp. NPDC014636 TaxID=3364876 RepID=UPI0036F606A3
MNEGNRVPPVVEGPEGAAGAAPTDRTENAGSAEDAGSAKGLGGPEGAGGAQGARGAEGAGGAVPDVTGAEGDFELAKPASVPQTGTAPGDVFAAGATAAAAGEPAAVAGRDTAAAGTERPMPAGEAAAVAPAAGETGVAGTTAVADPAERYRPLHDPDPYSTPPYGEPGPWAPAPPVQHPAATTTTATTAATAALGTAAPAPAAPPTPLPVPAAPAPAPAPSAATPATHAPAPASVPVVPAPAPVPSVPVVPAPAPLPSVPAAQAPAPVPAAHAPAAAPSGSVPHVPGQGAAPVPADPVASGTATGPASLVPPVDSVPSGEEPWGRYDPWAAGSATEQVLAQGPLQQTGVGRLTDEQRLRRAKRRIVVWALAIALVSAGIGGVVGGYVEREGLGGGVRLPQAGSVPAGRAPDSVAGIAARALPSVVTLHVKGADQAGTGTGFVLDARGHILTNNHVVEPAGSGGEISVTFSSGDTVKATVVGRDSGYDLAVVQVHGVHGLTPLPLGNSDDVEVGDPVVAIGAPFDLANTVTSGIISAKERPITAGGEKSDGSDVSYVDALQTDAPINPGNSGGPLLDSRAEVIGINSAIRSAGNGSGSAGGGQAGSIGLGFAIPVNQAKRVAEELIDEGHASHPVIGVTLDMGYGGDGARIDSKSASGGPAVTRDGPGERAGLKAGDLITEVGGERVHTGEELIVKIRTHRPGDRLRLTVERGGTQREVSLVLGASEQN